jgi:Tol biopolymer transport system component
VDPAPDAGVAVPDQFGGPVAVGPSNVLYVSGFPGRGQPALWRFDRQSHEHVQGDDADLCRPTVSMVDGTIAYCKDGAIVIRDGDGSGDRRVVASDATDPALSPDGARLAYVDRSNNAIWTVAVDGSDRRQLTDARQVEDRFPTWSPDGSRLAFVHGSSGSRGVWIVDVDGGNPRLVWGYSGGLDAFPLDWSPDGRLLAITCSPSLNAVCLLDVATGKSEPITPDWMQATSPSWSPDGSLIAFTAHPGTTTATSEVWVMRSDGTDERQLWPVGTGDDPAWYPVFLPPQPITTR